MSQNPSHENPSPAVTVYADKEFGGGSQQFQPGRYNLDYSQVGEDTISSIRVPQGWSVTVHQDRDLAGSSATFTADTRDLGEFDDTVSSIIVSDTIVEPRQVDKYQELLLEEIVILL